MDVSQAMSGMPGHKRHTEDERRSRSNQGNAYTMHKVGASSYQDEVLDVYDEFMLKKLKVRVIEAKNLVPADRNGFSDPYVKIRGSRNQTWVKTGVKKKTLNPKWEDKFTLEVGECVYLEVWDKDLLSSDDKQGDLVIRVQGKYIDLDAKKFPIRGVECEQTFKLSGVKHGEITLGFTPVDFGDITKAAHLEAVKRDALLNNKDPNPNNISSNSISSSSRRRPKLRRRISKKLHKKSSKKKHKTDSEDFDGSEAEFVTGTGEDQVIGPNNTEVNTASEASKRGLTPQEMKNKWQIEKPESGLFDLGQKGGVGIEQSTAKAYVRFRGTSLEKSILSPPRPKKTKSKKKKNAHPKI
eukprot:TRINITY_DN9071_c0_g1_i1.p1 TRINITY_DN9071_c0_g1~~TRINITY_DN9071_c0_g1_i1.p1  ORF type:complete len:354 (-),score=101.01 TRINITY_DN9071_c0_g1_i1:45-1106(-)